MITVAIVAWAGAGAGAQDLKDAEQLLGRDTIAAIRTEGKLVRVGTGKPALLPSHAAAEGMGATIVSEGPDLLVEALFFLPRNPIGNPSARSAELASIYGLLRSIGSLEGIQYFSASRKTMRTFYAEAYRIESPAARVRLPDPPSPAPGSIPAFESLYSYQRDLSFGGNAYRYEFHSWPDAIAFSTTNLTRMSYGILPVLGPEALITRVLVIQANDGIVFYAESGADAPGVFRDKLKDSFGNRAEALFHWFEEKAKGIIASR